MKTKMKMQTGGRTKDKTSTPTDSTKIYVDQANKAYSAGKINKGKTLIAKAGEYNRKKTTSTFKTGGMVNANTKVQALKSAGSNGVKSGVNPKASASKVARGRVGGMSTAPKTATPKAKYGMSMKNKKSC